MKFPHDQLISELKTHPYTMITVLFLCAFAFWSYKTFAHTVSVNDKVAELERKVISNGDKIDRVLVLQLAEAIRGVQRQICQTGDQANRRTLQNTLDVLQEDYAELKNKRYPVENCEP